MDTDLKEPDFLFCLNLKKLLLKKLDIFFYIALSKTLTTIIMKHLNMCLVVAVVRKYVEKVFLNLRFTE